MLCIIVMLMVLVLPPKLADAEELCCPIQISEVKISSNNVKPGDTFRYSFTIREGAYSEFYKKYSDTPSSQYELCDSQFESAFANVTVAWQSPGYQSVVREYKWDSKKKCFKISGSIPVQKGMQPGKWTIKYINFADTKEGGASTFSIDNIEEWEDGSGEFKDLYMDLSFGDITVSGTSADNKAPVISLKSLKIQKKFVKYNEKDIFSVKVSDKSKIKCVKSMWRSVDKKGNEISDCTYNMKYNKKKKNYQCSIKLKKGESYFRLYAIYVEDIYGNKKRYEANQYNKSYIKNFAKMTIYKR